MKKIILLLLLVLVSVTASARKSYITMSSPNFIRGNSYDYINTYTIYLSGEVPEDIENKGFTYDSEKHSWSCSNKTGMKYSTAEILNLLSEYGYEVEYVDSENIYFLLSKEISSGQTISKGDVNTDGEINIADVNEVIGLILGYVKEHPEILEQIRK